VHNKCLSRIGKMGLFMYTAEFKICFKAPLESTDLNVSCEEGGLYCLFYADDCLCCLVVRVLGYRSEGPGSIPSTTKIKKSSGFGTGFTQPREYN
jgi:hypothetical protein